MRKLVIMALAISSLGLVVGCVKHECPKPSAAEAKEAFCNPGFIREAVAAGFMQYSPTDTDGMTNPFTGAQFECPAVVLTDKGIEAAKAQRAK